MGMETCPKVLKMCPGAHAILQSDPVVHKISIALLPRKKGDAAGEIPGTGGLIPEVGDR